MSKQSSETKAIRSGYKPSHEGEHSEAVFETSSYVYANSAESESVFSGKTKGNVYSRFTNPTVREFENRLAAVDNVESCIATSSGMSALLSVFFTFLKSGDEIICSKRIFGTTGVLLNTYFLKYGVTVTFVDLVTTGPLLEAISDKTKIIFFETPCNPTLDIIDIQSISTIAKKHNTLVVVDNTFLTPFGQNPFLFGADLVVYSTSKYIDGQGRTIGGAVSGSAEHIEQMRFFMRCSGVIMGAHTAWVSLKGLETLSVRMRQHCENAVAVTKWLTENKKVGRVAHPSLTTHPQYDLGVKQHKLHGAVISFTVGENKQDAWKVIDAMKMFSLTTNIGDTKSMITHPASTTHVKLTPLQRQEVGITDNLIRLSIGLEGVEEMIADLEQAIGGSTNT